MQQKQTPAKDEKNFERALENLRLERDGITADEEVRETEDASLQDKEYAFDESNTGTEEYHDADDEDVEDVFDNEDDLQ